MPLVVRQFPYVPGGLIIAAHNTTNEETLYNLVNGNLDDDNISSLAEAKVVFDTGVNGHDHDGTDSKLIDITQPATGGFLIRAETTGVSHAIVGHSSVSGFAGIAGTAEVAGATGGYFASNAVAAAALYVENQTAAASVAVCGMVNGNGIASHHILELTNQTSSTGKASLVLSGITTGNYGVYSPSTNVGTAIQIEHDDTAPGIFVDGDHATATAVVLQGRNQVIEIANDVNSIASAQVLRVHADGTSGIVPDTNGWVWIDGTNIAATSAAPVFSVSCGAAAGTVADFVGGVTSTAGTGSGNPWVLKVRSAGGEDQNALYVDGRTYLDGALAHGGTTLGAFGTTPTTKKTVTGSRSGGAALTNLLTALANYGIITDASSS